MADPYAILVGRIEESSGLHFPAARLPQLVAATGRAMRVAGATDLDDYVLGLTCGRLPIADLIEELVVGETYFFREPAQFTYLRRVVLPEIAARKPAPQPIRLWSAACASGEEAFSLAILLEEIGLAARGRVVGTDLSREHLRKAAQAVYGRWSLRGSDAFRARRYLTGSANVLTLEPAIQKRVRFEQLNLARDVYPAADRGIGDFDLVLCRNVLIYFDAATIAHVARRLYDSLAEGGWLVLGSSDPPLAEHAPFAKVLTEGGVFYRRQAEADDRPEAPLPSLLTPRVPRRRAPRALTPAPQVGEASPSPTLAAEATSLAHHDTRDLLRAEEEARAALRADPLLPAAHHRFALVAMELGHDAEAAEALRRALYLDRDQVMSHLALGMLKQRAGDARGARRAFRTVRRLCDAMPKADLVPLAEGACAAHIAAVAVTQDAGLPPASSKRHG